MASTASASSEINMAGPPAKRQRVDSSKIDKNALDNNSNTPTKEALMPPCPKVPPIAPAETEGRNAKQERNWRWASKHGMDPKPPIYGPKDTALWPEEAAELYRATKTNRDATYASRYMRWWFTNHEGMPARVPKIPWSAYTMYYSEQKSLVFQSAGKFNTKRDGKKIGAKWKTLGDDEKQPYLDKFAIVKAQFEENEEWWKEQMAVWREKRLERLRSEGVELDPVKRQSAGLEPLCECSKCGPISDNAVEFSQN